MWPDTIVLGKFLCLLARKCQTSAVYCIPCLFLSLQTRVRFFYKELLCHNFVCHTICKLSTNELQRLSSLYCVNLCAEGTSCSNVKTRCRPNGTQHYWPPYSVTVKL